MRERCFISFGFMNHRIVKYYFFYRSQSIFVVVVRYYVLHARVPGYPYQKDNNDMGNWVFSFIYFFLNSYYGYY